MRTRTERHGLIETVHYSEKTIGQAPASRLGQKVNSVGWAGAKSIRRRVPERGYCLKPGMGGRTMGLMTI